MSPFQAIFDTAQWFWWGKWEWKRGSKLLFLESLTMLTIAHRMKNLTWLFSSIQKVNSVSSCKECQASDAIFGSATNMSGQIFALKHCASKHEFWRTTSPRRNNLEFFKHLMTFHPHFWTFLLSKRDLTEKAREPIWLAIAIHLLVKCSGGWEGGMQQKPGFTTPAKLPRSIHQNFPRESSTTFEAFFPPRTKISRRNVETFVAQHLHIFSGQSNNFLHHSHFSFHPTQEISS